MGYTLLWIESLATSLLLVAVALAWAARVKSRIVRAIMWLPIALLLLVVYVALTFATSYLHFHCYLSLVYFFALLLLTFGYVAGVVVLRLVGFSRSSTDSSGAVRAAAWPLGRLQAAFLVVATLHMMTFWNLDLSIRQNMAAVRAESASLALSAAPARISDRENAALIYRQAFEMMGDTKSWPEAWNEWTTLEKPEDQKAKASDPALRELLAEKAPVLALLHAAAAKSACYFDRDYGRPNFGILLPELQQLRQTTKLLILDAYAKDNAGDRSGSLSDLNVIFTIGEHAANEPLLISMLVGAAIDRIALKAFQVIVSSGPVTEDELAQIKLQATISYQHLFERSMRMEEAFGGSVFCDMALGKIGAAGLAGEFGVLENLLSLYRVFLLADDVAAYHKLMARHRELASKPYAAAASEWAKIDDELCANLGGPLTAALLPALNRAAQASAEADANRRLAELALAMLRYRAKCQHLPQRLSDLVPEQLVFVPHDPFDNAPLRMKPTDHGTVIYSIGPDLTDDGGSPFNRKDRSGDLTFTIGK